MSQGGEPKSNWEKGRFLLGLQSRRRPCNLRIVVQVVIATLLVAGILKMHDMWILFNGGLKVSSLRQGKSDEAKLSQRDALTGLGDNWCSVHGMIWICTDVSGHKVQGRDDPTPRPDCLGGFESWGVCQDGKFLCRAEVSEPVVHGSSDHDEIAPPTCALWKSQFSCTDRSRRTNAFMCLDSASSAGICAESDALCCAAEDSCPLGEKAIMYPSKLNLSCDR